MEIRQLKDGACSEKDCLCWSSLNFHIEMFVSSTFNTVKYEDRGPFFKKWNVIILGKRIVCDFSSSMRMFMKFVEDCSKHTK